LTENINFGILIFNEKTKKIDDVIDGIGHGNLGRYLIDIKFVELKQENPHMKRKKRWSDIENVPMFDEYQELQQILNQQELLNSKTFLPYYFRPKTVNELENPAIIFIKSLKNFKLIFDNFEISNEYPKKMRFLFICEELTEIDLKNWPIYADFLKWKFHSHMIESSFFLVDEEL
jgi:hypothetical protein